MRGKNERFNFGLYLRFMFMISLVYRVWDLLYNFPPFPAPQQFTVESSEEKQSDPEDGQDQSQTAVPEVYSYSHARPGHVRKGKTTRWHCKHFEQWTSACTGILGKVLHCHVTLSCILFLSTGCDCWVSLQHSTNTAHKDETQEADFVGVRWEKVGVNFCEHEPSLHGKTGKSES